LHASKDFDEIDAARVGFARHRGIDQNRVA
jgi:hypothetical protein